jgi:ABC-type Na+ efflux pump permease subunit
MDISLMFGILGACITIASHSYKKFHKVSFWTLVPGVYFLIALFGPGFHSEYKTFSFVAFFGGLIMAITAWGIFFLLYYAFSGRKERKEVVGKDDRQSDEEK